MMWFAMVMSSSWMEDCSKINQHTLRDGVTGARPTSLEGGDEVAPEICRIRIVCINPESDGALLVPGKISPDHLMTPLAQQRGLSIALGCLDEDVLLLRCPGQSLQ
jgi:hypothetical protein